MKWLLNIKDHLEFFRTEFKKNTDSWLLIIFASVIVLGVVSIILMSLSKTTIFPKDNERYDIDTIYVGQMKDFCSKELERNPGKKEFESCVLNLSIEKMIKVKVPTFDDTLDRAPSLPYMLKHSNNNEFKKAGSYFKNGNYFIIGFKIPEQYFLEDGGYIKNSEINVEKAFNYYVLTFSGLRFGVPCVGNECNGVINYWSQNVTKIPLIRGRENTSNIVWIFGVDNVSPHGIWLDDGIMVTRVDRLYSAHLFYSLFLYGKAMFASIAFVALFLVSIPFAIYLRRFFDYPAFSYFAGSTALWFISRNLFVIFPWLKGFTYRLFNIWIVLNFLLSILILNLAYARFKKVLKKRYFFIAHIIILSLVLFANFYFKDLGSMVAVWGRIELIFSNIATVVSLMPLAYGIYELTKY